MTIRTQSDVEFAGIRAGNSPNERNYDIAGVPHVPEFISLLRYVGGVRQNPASWRPVAKALLLRLAAWVENDVQPPESIDIDGDYDEQEQFRFAADADGNALGGIRLPHMSSSRPERGSGRGSHWRVWRH